jgi:hypothetical protein
MSEIDAETLLPDPKLHSRIVMGRMSQLHRAEPVAEEGDTFEVQGSTFEITDVTERTIDDINMSDVRSECATTPEKFVARLEAFDGSIEEGETLYRYEFERKVTLDIEE